MIVDHKGRPIIDPFNTHHAIIDLETFDTSSRAAIFALGLVIVDPELKIIFKGEYILTDPFRTPTGDSRFANYKVSESTVAWWLSEDQVTANHYLEDRGTYDSIWGMLNDISHIIKQCPKDDFLIYGNPSDFDISILTNAYAKTRVPLPWKYHQSACLRTLKRLAYPGEEQIGKFEGIKHTPLADAYHEAKELIHVLSYLRE